MRQCSRAATILLAIGAVVAADPAKATTLAYAGKLASFTASATGMYDIYVAGAQGGANYSSAGGLGATVEGDVFLSAGETLSIVVGGQGINGVYYPGGWGSSGGGSSFVFQTATALAIAGGGADYFGCPGLPGLADLIGGSSGGVAESGGGAGPISSGDGGWAGNGTTGSSTYGVGGGFGSARLAGGTSDAHGPVGRFVGGFSGGGAGRYNDGGGSYLAPPFTNDIERSGAHSGNDEVDITFVSAAPEPATMSLLAAGLIGLGLLRHKRACHVRRGDALRSASRCSMKRLPACGQVSNHASWRVARSIN